MKQIWIYLDGHVDNRRYSIAEISRVYVVESAVIILSSDVGLAELSMVCVVLIGII